MRKSLFILFLLASTVVYGQVLKVACVGNSITEGAGIAQGEKYPDVLGQLLGEGYEVRNYGLGGRTLLKKGDNPYWQEQLYHDVLEWQPDIVVIKLGTNDSKPQNWKYKNDFVQDYREFIRSFEKLASKPKVYVCLPIPVYKTAWGITEEIVKGEVIPLIRKAAKAEKVELIDLYTALVGYSAMIPDGVHPNAEGAKIIAETVYQAIK